MKYIVLSQYNAVLPFERGERKSGVVYKVELGADLGIKEVQEYFVADDEVKENVLGAALSHFNLEIQKQQEALENSV